MNEIWKFVTIFNFIIKIVSTGNLNHEHGFAHRNNWSRHSVHNRHNHDINNNNDDQWSRLTTRDHFQETTKNPMIQNIVIDKNFKDTERNHEKNIRHHMMDHRHIDNNDKRLTFKNHDKFSAMAINDYNNGRSQALAYATFHDNYRSRENNSPVYHHVTTTTMTPTIYTKHHSGYVN